MTRTAKRRWSREIKNEVDGIAIGGTGPVLLHGYDPPAGGMWVDDAIPGKLAAFDRSTGDDLWVSPCEVGYGRGFGAGFGQGGEVVVLGPSPAGYRMVRMAPDNGELMGVGPIASFDQAVVSEDLCICLSATRVIAFDTTTMTEAWVYGKETERYHLVGRDGDRVFVVFSKKKDKKQGVLAINAQTGRSLGVVLPANQSSIHDLAVDAKAMVILTEDLETALPPELLADYLAKTADDEVGQRRLSLLAIEPSSGDGDAPLWYETVGGGARDELPEASISTDSGKLYVIRGAFLEVRDALTGRALGEWTVPGLDERIAWKVCDGAGLLAEETRVTVFELPA